MSTAPVGGPLLNQAIIWLNELFKCPYRGYLKNWWRIRPERCLACRGWFPRDFFFNPWGPRSGRGLTCSLTCLNAIQRQEGMRETQEEDLA